MAIIERPTHAAAAAALLTSLVLTAAAQAQPSVGTPVPVWGPNGRVSAMHLDGDTLYVGGDFNQVGPPTGAFAVIDAADASSITTGFNPGPFGRAIRADGAGGYYLMRALSPSYLAPTTVLHLTAAGAVDPAWTPPVFDQSPSPPAMAVDGGRLYVGGYFTSVNGLPRGGLVALDGTSGAVLGWNASLSRSLYPPYIDRIGIAGGRLYASGGFDAVGGVARTDLAILDASSGALLPGQLDPGLGHPSIIGMAVTATRVYLYGACRLNGFVICGYQPDLTPLPGWTFPFGNQYIAASGSSLYAVASTSSPPFGQRVQQLDPDTGAATAWASPVFRSRTSPALDDIVVDGGKMYVSGNFSDANGQPRWNVARLDATSGALDAWAPVVGGEVTSLAVGGGRVAVTGAFNSAGGVGRDNLVAIDLRNGRPAAVQPPAPAFWVWDMTAIGDVMVVGGVRSYGVAGPDITAFTRSTGAPVPWSLASNGTVSALATDGRSLFISGRFSELSGTPRLNLGAVSLATGTLTSFNPQPTGVSTMAVSGDTLFIAGEFTFLPGYGRDGVGAFDTRTGEVLPFAPSNPNTVFLPPVAGFAFSDSRVLLTGVRSEFNQPPQGIEWVDRQSGGRTAQQIPLAITIVSSAQAGSTVAAMGYTPASEGMLTFIDLPSGRVHSDSLGQTGGATKVALSARYVAVGGLFDALGAQSASNLAVYLAPRTGAPRQLTSSVVANTVTLGWQAGDDPPASAYVVEVGTTAGASDLGVFGVGSTTRVSGGLAAGTYFARVRGIGANGPGAASSELVITTPARATPPQAPSGLNAAVANGVVTLSWTAAAGNATTYIVEAGTAPGLSNIGALPLGHLDTTFRTPAPPGTYVVRVRAANAFGASPASNELTVVVP